MTCLPPTAQWHFIVSFSFFFFFGSSFLWIKGTIGIYSYIKWLCSKPGYLALICSDVHVTPSWTRNDVDWMSICKYICTCLCSDSAQTPFGWRWIRQRRTRKICRGNIFWIWQANNASTCAGAKDLLKLLNHKRAQIQLNKAPQPREIKISIVFALSLTKEEKRQQIAQPLFYLFAVPTLFLCLSPPLSSAFTLQLTDLKTVAFLSELSLYRSLVPPCFPLKRQNSD